MIEVKKMERSEEEWAFLTDMMYESIHIPENKPPKDDLLNSPSLRKYSEGWGRRGDRAIIAFENQLPVGAAWYRLFSENQKGYGYVDDKTPELGVAVARTARGKGTGSLLVKKLIEAAVEDGYRSLSLSVDPENLQAVRLYEKLGFQQCGLSGTSWTMVYTASSSEPFQ